MQIKRFLAGIFLLVFSITWAQQVEVKGTVTDESGEPLPGVNVVVKGTQKGTVTDFDGKYRIKTDKGSVLVFSFLGYESKELKVQNPGVYNIKLKQTSEALDPVVVTAMGIKKKEKALGYAVQEVKMNSLKTPQTDVFTSMQGELSGVLIQQTSGTPGAGVDILIRGMTSIDPNQSNQPLIVIDGIPISNDVTYGNILPSDGTNAPNSAQQFSFANRGLDINPDDIQSVTVLKGAAATALYGIKAANGAIIITTKKGYAGKPTFTFSSKVTTNRITKWFEPQTTYREGYGQTAKLTMDPNHPGILNPQPRDYGPGKGFWLIAGTYSFHTWGPRYSEDDDSTIRFHNVYDEFFRTGVTYDNNFSMRGGTDKYNYYLSLGNIYAKSIVPYTDFNKSSVRFRGEYQLSEKVSAEISSNYIYTKSKLPNNGDKSIMSSLAYWSTSVPLDRIWGPDGRSWNYTPYWIDNPHYFAYISSLTSENNRFINGLNLKYFINKDWNFVFRGGVDTYTNARNRFVPPDLDVGTQVEGFVYNDNIKFRQLNANFLLNYNKEISKDLNFSATFGNEILSYKRTYEYIRGEGLVIPDYNHISNTTNLYSGERTIRRRLVGLFSEMRLDYKDRLFLNVTGRNDWTSTFVKENRSFFYPSTSLSFVFHDFIDKSEENFSFGKIRLAYAEVGKDAAVGRLGQFFYLTNTLPGGVPGTYQSSVMGDINARPERQITKEIGFDLRFFDNRFRIDYTYYDVLNKDMLFSVPAPNSSGLSSVYKNVGKIQNWGHELMLSGYIVNKDNFSWRTMVNYTKSKGKVLELDESIDQIVFGRGNVSVIVNMVKEGDYLGTLYGYTWLYNDDGQIIVDSNKRPQIDWSERKIVGNAFPDWIGSLGNHFTFGKLGFGFNIEYKKGGDIYDDFIRTATRNGNAKVTEDRYEEVVWPNSVVETAPGVYQPNDQTMVKNESWYRYSRYTWASETQLHDGTWIKLRNIYLTYDLPEKFFKNSFVSKVTLNLSMSNYILWTEHQGWDPEGSQYAAGSNIYGFVGYSTPLTTNISLGLNVQL
jgi:TonB-linked SusC/RagA family outer membrane protein